VDVCSTLSRERHKDRKGSVETRKLVQSDVIEAPSRRIELQHDRIAWSYGTVGTGLDLMGTLWPEDNHKFSCQQRFITPKVKSKDQTQQLGSPQRVKPTFLNEQRVNALLIDLCKPETWIGWLEHTKAHLLPGIVVYSSNTSNLAQEAGSLSKPTRKRMALHSSVLASVRLGVWGTVGSTKDCNGLSTEHGGH
jgi:hypothetical protein